MEFEITIAGLFITLGLLSVSSAINGLTKALLLNRDRIKDTNEKLADIKHILSQIRDRIPKAQ